MAREKIIELPPIRETKEDYDALEARLKDFFKRVIYFPLLKELKEPRRLLKNAPGDYPAIQEALLFGRITFSRGVFSGRFNSTISKEMQKLGARWDRKNGTWRLLSKDLPYELKSAVAVSETRFQEKMAKIDEKLSSLVGEDAASHFKAADLFDHALYQVEKDFQANVARITVAPKLSPEQRKKISDEWEKNMQLFIKDFTEKEVMSLRAKMKKTLFASGRYESVVSEIQRSYRVSANKAKFLARQETGLMMAKFKETRYLDAGIREYTWHNVVGSPKHPVRPRHKALGDASKKGQIFRFDDPPITSEPNQPVRRNNPGEDYNCRCFAKPLVRFKEKS